MTANKIFTTVMEGDYQTADSITTALHCITDKLEQITGWDEMNAEQKAEAVQQLALHHFKAHP